jgi:hypothetical protein
MEKGGEQGDSAGSRAVGVGRRESGIRNTRKEQKRSGGSWLPFSDAG